MGPAPSKNIIDESTTVVNDIISNIMLTTNQNAVQLIMSNQVNNVSFKGQTNFDCDGGVKINLINSTDISAQLVTNFTNQAVTQIKNALLNDITNKNSQIMKIVNGFLSGLGGGSKNENSTTIKNMISNYINNNIDVTTLQSSLQQVTGIQENNLSFVGNVIFKSQKDCDISFSNSYQANLTMKAIASNIVNAFITNSVTNDVTNRVDQTMDVKNEGIEGAIYAAAALAIACGLFYVLQGIGQRIGAKAGGGATGGGSSKFINILFIIVVIAIIGFFIYNQYTKKQWPFHPSVYWGCSQQVFTDPVTGQKSIMNGDGCKSYSKDDNRGIYSTKEICDTRTADPNNNTCGKYWGCKYDENNKPVANSCVQYPTAFYTLNYKDNPRQVNASFIDQNTCLPSCVGKWTCQKDQGGFPIPGKCRQVYDQVEISNISASFDPNNFNLCSTNNTPPPKAPLYNTQEDCENDIFNSCKFTWACTNPGTGDNACSQNVCPVTCTDSSCDVNFYKTKDDCNSQCPPKK